MAEFIKGVGEFINHPETKRLRQELEAAALFVYIIYTYRTNPVFWARLSELSSRILPKGGHEGPIQSNRHRMDS